MLLLHYLSLAWIADRLFGRSYYSMHFELVLDDLLDREKQAARDILMTSYVHGAIDACTWDGIFADTINAEIDPEGGRHAVQRGDTRRLSEAQIPDVRISG